MSSKSTIKEFKGTTTKLLVTEKRAALMLTKFQLKGIKMALDKINTNTTVGRGSFSEAATELRKLCGIEDRKHAGELLDLFHVLRNVHYVDKD